MKHRMPFRTLETVAVTLAVCAMSAGFVYWQTHTEKVFASSAEEIAVRGVGEEIVSLRKENTEVFKAENGELTAKIYLTPKYYLDDGTYKEIDTSTHRISILDTLNPLKTKTYDSYIDAGAYRTEWFADKPWDYKMYVGDSWIQYKALFDESASLAIKMETLDTGMKETIILKDDTAPTTLQWKVTESMGKSVITTPPPTAIDANGKDVPVVSNQVDDVLTYEVDTRDAVFPIAVDPTSVTATNDDTIRNYSDVAYATERDAAVGGDFTDSIAVGQVYMSGIPRWLTWRAFLSFAIPEMVSLTSASLFLYGSTDESATNFNIYVLTSTYSNPIVVGDFDLFDGHQASGAYNGTTLNNAWSTTSYSATWNELSLNASGLSAVLAKKNDTFKVALISSKDSAGTAATSGSNEYVIFANTGFVGQEPYLSITYTAPVAPTVTTQAVSGVHSVTATGNGNVTDDGGGTITERGVVVSTSANPTTANDKFTSAGTTGAFVAPITERAVSTLYHVRAFATNSAGTSYGDDVTFTTDPTSIQATNNGRIYILNATYTTARNAAAGDATDGGYFQVGQTTDYYVIRSFASFAIPEMTSLTSASLFLEGQSDSSVTDFDVYILTSTYSNPLVLGDFDLFDGHQASGAYNGTVLNDTWNTSSYSATWNEFTFNAAGLSAILAKKNDTFKIVVISKEDYDNSAPAGGESVIFEPTSTVSKEPYLVLTYTTASAPTVTTQIASPVTATTATLNGNIIATGEVNVTVRGFAYGTDSTLSTVIATTTDTVGQPFDTGAFTGAPGSALTCNTTYYSRAYATNSAGTGLGAISDSFTTSPCIPTVTTQSASSVTATTATLNGNITGTGVADVTVRGFAYGTDSTLSTVIATTTDTVGQPFDTGAFTSAIADLTKSVRYYVRAYATNSEGTGLGSIQSFTTTIQPDVIIFGSDVIFNKDVILK